MEHDVVGQEDLQNKQIMLFMLDMLSVACILCLMYLYFGREESDFYLTLTLLVLVMMFLGFLLDRGAITSQLPQVLMLQP